MTEQPTNETVSVTRALKELKVLGDRIGKSIGELKVLDITQNKFKGKALKTNQSVDDFTKNVKSKFQSLQDLLTRRTKLKSAIIVSNAATTIEVGGKSMTVAETLDFKTFLEFKRDLLKRLKTEKAGFDRDIINARVTLERQVDVLIEQNIGKDRKADKEDYDKIAKPYMEANELRLIDPVGVQKVIEGLDEEITKFEADVDIVLSESNSRTEISF